MIRYFRYFEELQEKKAAFIVKHKRLLAWRDMARLSVFLYKVGKEAHRWGIDRALWDLVKSGAGYMKRSIQERRKKSEENPWKYHEDSPPKSTEPKTPTEETAGGK